MSTPDWSLGEFEAIAPQLLPAAQAVIETTWLPEGVHVVDVGCGTGTAALLAARPGVLVTGVDPAERLLEVARTEAKARDLEITFIRGEAAAMPLPDGCADVVLSMFGVIFAPDPAAAAAELARITAPTGRITLTAWLPEGPLFDAAMVPMDLLAKITGAPQVAPFTWHDRDAVARLLGPYGFDVSVQVRELAFTAPSIEEYWEINCLRHPYAVATMPLFEQHNLVSEVRSRTVDVLTAANEDPTALRFTARYVVITAQR